MNNSSRLLPASHHLTSTTVLSANDFRYSDALAAKWAGRLDPIIVLAIALAAVAPDELYLDTDLQLVLEFTVQ